MNLRAPLALICCVVLASTANVADAESKYAPFFEAAADLSEVGLGLRASSFAPFWSDGSNLVFFDVRGRGAYHDGVDVSWGLGWRHRTHSDWIVGGYGYFDRTHMRPETTYNQAMFGMELLNIDWAFRVNGYLPENDTELLVGGQAILVGDELILRHPIEGTYYGTDFEVGYLLHDWFDGALELRGYAGGFYFNRNDGGFEMIAGPSVRSELRLYDLPWLGNQSRLVAISQYRWDQVRGPQGLVSLGIRIAFGKSRAYQLSRRDRRMLTPVQRSDGVLAEIGVLTEPAVFANGEPIATIGVIDANTPNPTDALAQMGENSIAVFDGEAGKIEVSKPFQLKNYQTILGGGGGEIPLRGERTGVELGFQVPGTPPMVMGRDPSQNIFELPPFGGVIAGVGTNGGRNGIYGHGSADYAIVGNMTVNAVGSGLTQSGNGIFIKDPGPNGLIGGNLAFWNEQGILIEGPFDGTLERNQTLSNRQHGIHVAGSVEGHVLDNESHDNGTTGIWIEKDVRGDVSGNTTDANGRAGINIDGGVTGDVADNVVTNNRIRGLNVDDNILGSLVNNTVTNNGGSFNNSGMGITISGEIFGDVSGNTASGNKQIGISLQEVRGDIANNIVEDNGYFGLTSDGVGGNVIGNRFLRNGERRSTYNQGLFIIGRIDGIIAENVAKDNRGEGIRLELLEGEELLLKNNEFSGNNRGAHEFVANMFHSHERNGSVILENNLSTNTAPGPDGANYRHGDWITLIDRGGNTGTIQLD